MRQRLRPLLVALSLTACSGDAFEIASDAPPVSVPRDAPCAVYQGLEHDGTIVPAERGVRIIVTSPFSAVVGASDPAPGGGVLVWYAERVGGELGAVGRVDNSDACVWKNAE